MVIFQSLGKLLGIFHRSLNSHSKCFYPAKCKIAIHWARDSAGRFYLKPKFFKNV